MTLRHDEDYDDGQPASAGKIKVVCHGCGARYQVRDSKVRGHRFRATCKRCGGIIVARCDNAFTVMPDKGHGGARPTRPGALRLGGDDLQQQEDEPIWYVAIAGKPHGPLTPIQVRKSFHAKRISGKTYLWRAGDPDWRRLVDMPEFVDLFGEAATSFYDAPSREDELGENTGETLAGGPMGRRRRQEPEPEEEDSQRDHFLAVGTVDPDQHRVIAPMPSDPSLEDYADGSGSGQTAVRHADELDYPRDRGTEESEVEETGIREGGMDNQWEPAQQPLWEQPAMVPRRRAVLPAPTGAPRHFQPPALPAPVPAPPAALEEPPPLFAAPGTSAETRPLSDDEKIAVRAGPPPALPFPKPGIAPPSPSPPLHTPGPPPLFPPNLAPPPASSFLPELPPPPPARAVDDALKPVGPQPVLPPLREEQEESFWTAGKIAAAAAIAGGLAVALTVVLVVAVMRPKQQRTIGDPGPAVTAVKPKAPEVKINVVAPKEPKPEPKEEPKAEAKPEPKAEPKAEAKAEAKAEPKEEPEDPRPVAKAKPEPKEIAAKPAEPKAPPVTRTKLKKKAGRTIVAARPKGKAEKPQVDVDDLLAAGASKKPAPKKKAPVADDSAADDVLAAGTQRKSAPAALPVRPSREQIQAAIRPILGRVQACYDKFRQAGEVKIQITLRPDGTHSSGVVSSTAGAESASCVAKALRSARFPRFSGPEIAFAYPFALK
jgi:hypothetical protein